MAYSSKSSFFDISPNPFYCTVTHPNIEFNVAKIEMVSDTIEELAIKKFEKALYLSVAVKNLITFKRAIEHARENL